VTAVDWSQAVCAHADPEIFFGNGNESHTEAILICYGCPLRYPCLIEAVRQEIPAGIYGGKTPEQRKAIRRGAPIEWKPLKCGRGHDLAKVGINPRGHCRECRRVRDSRYDKTRRQVAADKAFRAEVERLKGTA
jgi:WhiB family redox-sensing transcriptional regulator